MAHSAPVRQATRVRSRLYRSLYESRDFCSKQTLARACGISMPTLYQNLNELMDEGLVRYSGEEQFTGGRRAQGLEIVPDARVSVGISVTEHHLRIAAADLRLNELAYQTLPFDLLAHLERGGQDAALSDTLEAFLIGAGIDRSKLLGVGITIPGVLTPDHQRIYFAPTLQLRDVPLSLLTRDVAYPVYVDNDGTASGHAEYFVRGRRGTMAYLSLENGVGGAVLMGGALCRGDNARSGEFGHICVELGGLPCACGKTGCLEAYCSARRIEERFGVTVDEFFRGVEERRPEYEAPLYDMLRHLAVAVHDIRMMFDCDVVLGGFLSEYLQPYLDVLCDYVRALDPFSEDTGYVQLTRLRRHITPLGAALHFLRGFLMSV